MRGKRTGCSVASWPVRIIPAHAGQTCTPRTSCDFPQDHPRACGANACMTGVIDNVDGSSPRMRGKPGLKIGYSRTRRIIPAHAGQTTHHDALLACLSDHPRACGANWPTPFPVHPANGSSPRMRGKQSDFMRKLLSAGPSIIGFAQWLQSSYYCSCLQSSAKTPISRGTTPTSLFLGFQNSITLLLLT